jgi:hypothetical protein
MFVGLKKCAIAERAKGRRGPFPEEKKGVGG